MGLGGGGSGWVKGWLPLPSLLDAPVCFHIHSTQGVCAECVACANCCLGNTHSHMTAWPRHHPGSMTPPGHRALMLHQSPRSSGPTGVKMLHVVKFPTPPPRHEAIWSINKTRSWSMRGVSVDLSEMCLRSTALPALVAWSVKWCLWQDTSSMCAGRHPFLLYYLT